MTIRAPAWDERWDGPRQQSRRKGTDSVLSFLRPDDSPQDEFSYVWERWANPEYRHHQRQQAVLELADNGKAQEWQIRVYAAAHGQQYAEELRQWLADQGALAEVTEDAATWIASQDFSPYLPGYADPYSLEAKRAREAMQASSEA